ncbi:hypothetical protein CPB85DRAFT_215169 [Mucidula mucida]|nr:hypothetical protein CPB85DRAFT_215169 [Mucidula mucida]
MERFSRRLAEDTTVIPRTELKFQDSDEIYTGAEYSIFTGTRSGAVVAVKNFAGPHAKTRWKQSVARGQQAIHPNVATLIGISGASDAKLYYTVYSKAFFMCTTIFGQRQHKWQPRTTASHLDRKRPAGVYQGMHQKIHGIAAGLLYLDSQGILVTQIGIDNMHVFSGNDSRAVIAIEWADQESSENVDSIPLSRPIDVLDALNLRVYQEANHILHDDWVSHSVSSEMNDELELVSEIHQRPPLLHRHRPAGRVPTMVKPCCKGVLSGKQMTIQDYLFLTSIKTRNV